MKKKFVVAVHPHVNQWLCAGAFTVNHPVEGAVSVEVVTHKEHKPEFYSGFDRIGDYDLRILPEVHCDSQDAACIILPRYTKPQQHILLHKLHQRFLKTPDGNGSRFINIPTYTARAGCESNHFNHPHDYSPSITDSSRFTNRLIIRPTNGARSMGQIIFNSSLYSIAQVLDMVYPRSNNREVDDLKTMDPIDAVVPANPSGVADAPSDTTKDTKPVDFFDKTSYPDGVSVFKGNASNAENSNVFREGYFTQPEVAKVYEEYRILVSDKGICAISLRPRESDLTSGDYKAVSRKEDVVLQWSENNLSTELIQEALEQTNPTDIAVLIATQLNAFVKANLDTFKYNSIDVFVTKDGGWGFFEFCNQFSVQEYGSTARNNGPYGYGREEVINRIIVSWVHGLVYAAIDDMA